ncbi:Mitochondrial carrier domain,Mitochondrial substrate/solute carrier [Cinara cedri]|uniref:Mitochondrial carrier domain,Mitochondrial substrate/solute carrier n=1 Tax=Cinara cedri TaxID=506608 RepID=A0A5E4N3Y4_9HEMI|nr:Mitochondrial carrier domain,Mitochondrial substrate/solute carrier [Cinara cedri]
MPRFIELISGGLAGITCKILVLPFDVVLTKFIIDSHTENPQFQNAWDCAKKIYTQSGPKIFFRGFCLQCLRVFPTCSIMFFVYGIFNGICIGGGFGGVFGGGSEHDKQTKVPATATKW